MRGELEGDLLNHHAPGGSVRGYWKWLPHPGESTHRQGGQVFVLLVQGGVVHPGEHLLKAEKAAGGQGKAVERKQKDEERQ